MTFLVKHEMRLLLSALIDMRTSILIVEYESDALMDISFPQCFQNVVTEKIVETVIVLTEINDLSVQLGNT